MIVANGLRKAYGSLVAVSDASFEVRPGETFGLLGPNGAGKSTTMLMLAGVLRPDAGTVSIDGADDPLRADVRRRLGMAPQALSLYETLTGEENLSFFGRMYGLRGPSLRQRVAWGLEFAGLTDRRRDRISSYSGGMKRRLNLACALVHDPQVLLLDEPTAGVDPQSRNHLFENIEALARQGRTILYTTHYMEEAERLCQRIAVMDHGRILALDSVSSLVAKHGGRSIVELDLAAPPPDSIALPAVVDGTRLRWETDQPLDDLGRLSAAGLKVSSFQMQRPNLETVFLSLTGRRLRD